ncbi:MAG: hemerythrin family protein [Rhodoferax sp.]
MFLNRIKALLLPNRRGPIHPADQQRSLESEISDPRLATIVWRKEYLCGHPRIDEQHKMLFLIGNRLINAGRQGHSKEKVERLIGEMSQHILDHFCSEELILVHAGHPLTQQHRDAHQCLQDRAAEFSMQYARGQVSVEDIVSFVAHDVIHGHIIKEDLKFAVKALA